MPAARKRCLPAPKGRTKTLTLEELEEELAGTGNTKTDVSGGNVNAKAKNSRILESSSNDLNPKRAPTDASKKCECAKNFTGVQRQLTIVACRLDALGRMVHSRKYTSLFQKNAAIREGKLTAEI